MLALSAGRCHLTVQALGRPSKAGHCSGCSKQSECERTGRQADRGSAERQCGYRLECPPREEIQSRGRCCDDDDGDDNDDSVIVVSLAMIRGASP